MRGGDRGGWGRGGLRLLALAIAVSIAGGCAYFNTFYHARKFFNKAEQIQRESKSDKLAPEALRNYDLAIEKASKVIFEHGGGWKAGIDDALYLQGQCYVGKKEYEPAIRKFNELILNFPDSDHLPDALFYTGVCYHRLRNHATGDRVFERVLRTYPNFHRRDEIALTIAEGYEEAGDRPAALAEYRRLIQTFKDSDLRVDALDRLGRIHYEEGRLDSALGAYRELARIAADDEVYFEAQLNAGTCLVRMGQPEEAISIYQRILPTDLRSESAGRVDLALAEAESRRQDHEAAIERLERVSQDFANRTLGIEADFRLGYTYEVHRQDYPKAREAYEKAARAAAQSVFKDQAQRRLANLQHLEELQSSTSAAEVEAEALAEAAFKVAEFSYFESQDATLALEQYQRVEEEFPAAGHAARAAYARAWILQHDLDSTARAAEIYAAVVERFPATPQAEQALRFLEELAYPQARLDELTILARGARQRQRAVDDSLARIEAAADSLAVLATAARQAAEQARADSLERVRRVGARSREAFEAAARAAEADGQVAALRAEAAAQVDSLTAGVDSASQVDSLAAAPDSAAVAAAPAPDSAAVAAAPAPDSAAVAALFAPRIAAARAAADSLRRAAEGVIDSVAHAQALQDSIKSATAAARADSMEAARAQADSAAARLAVERRAERARIDSLSAGADSFATPVDTLAVPADSLITPIPETP